MTIAACSSKTTWAFLTPGTSCKALVTCATQLLQVMPLTANWMVCFAMQGHGGQIAISVVPRAIHVPWVYQGGRAGPFVADVRIRYGWLWLLFIAVMIVAAGLITSKDPTIVRVGLGLLVGPLVLTGLALAIFYALGWWRAFTGRD